MARRKQVVFLTGKLEIQLRKFIDKVSVSEAVYALSNLCYENGIYAGTELEDYKLERTWDTIGQMLGSCAEKISKKDPDYEDI